MTRAERVIVFDLDDTLYLERDYAESGFRAVGAWMQATLGISDFAARALHHFNLGRRNDIFDAVLADLGIVASHRFVQRLVTIYRKHRPDIRLAPDAEALLTARPPDGTRFALITDGFLVAQSNKVRALGLAGLGLWPIICTDFWGRDYWKPHPRSFECVQVMFGLPPQNITYIADNPVKDFIAPRRLGWKTVQIVRPGRIRAEDPPSGEPADYSIDDLGRLDCASLCSLG